MSDVLYMAWRYLVYHKVKTTILIASITLIVYLPVGLNVVVSQSAVSLTDRAKETPLIIGAKGSSLELVLNSLYFESSTPESMVFGESTRIFDSELAIAIPLYTPFRARAHPIVGTTIDYFDFRNLVIAEGRQIALLGECVVGAKAANHLEVRPGDFIVSSPESVFDFAGVYPLKMKVVGILKSHESPDDHAIFVDIKTTWVIKGLAHGHEDLSKPEAASRVLQISGGNIIANASVVQYNEISPANIDAFHFHGDPSAFPLTAAIVVPHDEKSATLLQGHYLGEGEQVQIIEPTQVMDDLLATVLAVQNYVITAVVLVSLSTLATMALVFMLSWRSRQREIETIHKIGGAKGRVLAIVASEIVVVLAMGIGFAAVLTGLTAIYGSEIIRVIIS